MREEGINCWPRHWDTPASFSALTFSWPVKSNFHFSQENSSERARKTALETLTLGSWKVGRNWKGLKVTVYTVSFYCTVLWHVQLSLLEHILLCFFCLKTEGGTAAAARSMPLTALVSSGGRMVFGLPPRPCISRSPDSELLGRGLFSLWWNDFNFLHESVPTFPCSNQEGGT